MEKGHVACSVTINLPSHRYSWTGHSFETLGWNIVKLYESSTSTTNDNNEQCEHHTYIFIQLVEFFEKSD